MERFRWILFGVKACILLGRLSSAAFPAAETTEDGDSPLILTPYLKENRIADAVKASRVSLDELNNVAQSYSGFFTVEEKHKSNMFFWYIPCQEAEKKVAPLVIWLQGGPGAPSTFGLFAENGPFVIHANLSSVTQRDYSWTKSFNMLYFDQPVGTGFSFTDIPEGLAKDQEQIAQQLYEALKQFYQLFPDLLKSDLYLTGESYGGKYVPYFASKIHEENAKTTNVKMNLKGLAIGDGLYDAAQQLDHGDHLFQVGLADEKYVATFDQLISAAKTHVEQGQLEEAAKIFNEQMDYYRKESGLWDVENFSTDLKSDPQAYIQYVAFFKRPDVKRAIHVGKDQVFGANNNKVGATLQPDVPRSSLPKLEQLLDAGYDVMVYHGQLDVIIPYSTTQKMFENMTWNKTVAYRKSKRFPWKVGKAVAGYVRKVDNFVEVLVRNSGHIVPANQPARAYDLITKFVGGKPLTSETAAADDAAAAAAGGPTKPHQMPGDDDSNLNRFHSNPNPPLILTKLIHNNELEKARKASQVSHSGLAKVAPSHSGYFTVNPSHNSNIFFWYVPAQNHTAAEVPLLLWLQGGPGASSLFGLFQENGPYVIGKNDVTQREFAWSTEYNMLYIDQPVGTGYSFTGNDEGYAKNEDDVASDIYEALRQFFVVFPHLRQCDFYVTGESYAGKYAPAIADKIDRMNGGAGIEPRIALKGIAIGDGLIDPFQQLNYGDLIIQTGLGDANDKSHFVKSAEQARNLMKQNKSAEAGNVIVGMTDYFVKTTHLANAYNYLSDSAPDFQTFEKFVTAQEVKSGIHVGGRSFDTNAEKVFDLLTSDIPVSSGPLIERLLDKSYKVMLYNGQTDVNIPYAETEKMVRNLRWKGQEAYRHADRHIWKVDGNVAGYAKEVLNLRQVMVRNAGHMVPADQPKLAFDMINRFVKNQPFGESPFLGNAADAAVKPTHYQIYCVAIIFVTSWYGST